MNALLIASGVFLLVGASAMTGLALHNFLPDHHRDGDSREVIKLIMALIATMAALVLSLLIASANSTYRTQESEIEHSAANIIQIDRMLATYGPDALDARRRLRVAVETTALRLWRQTASQAGPTSAADDRDAFFGALLTLEPRTEAQRTAKSMALRLSAETAKLRLLMTEQLSGSLAWPFLMVLIFWLAVLFLGFGLFVRRNPTVIVSLLVGAASVAGAIFLIVEMNQPYSGLMQISSAPIRSALERITP